MKTSLITFIAIIAGLILLGYLLPKSEPPKLIPPPCEDVIDYDWENHRYICPTDTFELMRNPYGRGWIRKDTFHIIEKVNPLPYKRKKKN